MIDPEKAFRRAVYQALISTPIRLSIDGSNSDVAIFDGPVDDSVSNAYVAFSNQSGVQQDHKSGFVTPSTIVLDIVCRGEYEISKDYCDDISEQIEAILLPGSPGTNGLIPQAGVIFGRLKRIDARYIELNITSTQTIIRKLVTFGTTVYQAA